MTKLSEPVDVSAVMPFGLYKDKRVIDLPDHYLSWLLGTATVKDPALLSALEREWARRAPKRATAWPVCARCGNTTDRLVGPNKLCSRCAVRS